MEKLIKIHVEKLPEGIYLATSDDVQGLVAQGNTIAETLDIAKEVARELIEIQSARSEQTLVNTNLNSFDCSLIVSL